MKQFIPTPKKFKLKIIDKRLNRKKVKEGRQKRGSLVWGFISIKTTETKKIAMKLARNLRGGETLALIGDLGSGKTVFTKGLAHGLGIKKVITSPTFVLMKVYEVANSQWLMANRKKSKTRRPIRYKPSAIRQLVHVDAYRLNNGQELEAIGIKDYFNDKNCVTVIEWADRVKDILPKNCIRIEFEHGKKDKRIISIKKMV